MATEINALNCKKLEPGTGLVDCIIRFRQPKTIIRTSPAWKFDPATETFDAAYVISKIQDGTFTPFLNTLEFVNNTPDPTTKEYQGGAVSVIRNGKPQKSFEYDNGIYWHAAAYSYNGFRTNAVIEVDKSGNVRLMSNVAGDSLSAFTTNMFNTSTYMDESGDETAKTIIQYQIDNEEAYNTRSVIITKDTIGADLNEEIQGIIPVNITATASATTGFTLKVTYKGNTSFGIQGLTLDNIRVTNVTDDAAQDVATLVAGANPGEYTGTFDSNPTAADELIFETYDADATPPVAVAKVGDNQLYKGTSGTVVTGA